EALARGEYPGRGRLGQMMDDHDHPELGFDPLGDTKTWPEQDFPPKPVGRMVLDRMPENYFAENEQISFGTGVLVDGLDFSDDKMLVGRTFSYSDTQRYRVGPNYLQLPVNQARNAEVRTNQRDGQMTYHVDGGGENPQVNYEPSITGGLREGEFPTHDEQGPEIRGRLTRKRIPRTNDYLQAGQRYCLMEDWERDDLVKNFIDLFGQCDQEVRERMVWHCYLAENDLGRRVGEGLGITPEDLAGLEPLASQDLTDEDRKRLANLGDNPPRDVEGLTMTHCVPNERLVVPRRPTGPSHRRSLRPRGSPGAPHHGTRRAPAASKGSGARRAACPARAAAPPARPPRRTAPDAPRTG